jgi:hypothetical protein
VQQRAGAGHTRRVHASERGHRLPVAPLHREALRRRAYDLCKTLVRKEIGPFAVRALEGLAATYPLGCYTVTRPQIRQPAQQTASAHASVVSDRGHVSSGWTTPGHSITLPRTTDRTRRQRFDRSSHPRINKHVPVETTEPALLPSYPQVEPQHGQSLTEPYHHTPPQ